MKENRYTLDLKEEDNESMRTTGRVSAVNSISRYVYVPPFPPVQPSLLASTDDGSGDGNALPISA